jgi:4-amino-4-deoxy-L-arabinose transferase-like glycosyltransferase
VRFLRRSAKDADGSPKQAHSAAHPAAAQSRDKARPVLNARAAMACYLMLALAYLIGLGVPMLDGAAAGYANTALSLHAEGIRAQVGTNGPPLLFWLSAFSFEMFGVNVVAYKLPSLLFSALAVYSTVRVGAVLYNEDTGRLAGVILASAFALLFAANNADMDAILIGSVIFTTSQLMIFVTDTHKLAARAHLVVAGLGLAIGLAARGLPGVILPLFAVFLFLVYRLEWRKLFDPFWLLLPLSAFLFVFPLIYLWHEETGQNGMAFIQWAQSAEQLSAENPFLGEGMAERFFYYYTYLWAFLPWSAIALWAAASSAHRLVNDRYWPRARGEAVTLGVVVSTFIYITVSQFHLLHYVTVLLPFFAVLLAGWLPARLRHPASYHWLWRVQYVVFALILDAALVFNGWMFPLHDWQTGIAALALLALGIWFIPLWTRGSRLIIVTVSISTVFWLLANANLYPGLLENQAGTALGSTAIRPDQRINPDNIFCLDSEGPSASLNIAIREQAKPLTLDEISKRTGDGRETILFVTAEGREKISAYGLSFDVLASSPNYSNISLPRWKFLNPHTRKDELRTAYLLRMKQQS